MLSRAQRELSAGLLLLRIIVGSVFLYHGISLLMMGSTVSATIGSAATNLGLTFFSEQVWFYIAAGGQVVIGILLFLGVWTRLACLIICAVMFFAMSSKNWAFDKIEYDIVLAALGFVMLATGPGRYAICKKDYEEEYYYLDDEEWHEDCDCEDCCADEGEFADETEEHAHGHHCCQHNHEHHHEHSHNKGHQCVCNGNKEACQCATKEKPANTYPDPDEL